jgi:hypothetical protein
LGLCLRDSNIFLNTSLPFPSIDSDEFQGAFSGKPCKEPISLDNFPEYEMKLMPGFKRSLLKDGMALNLGNLFTLWKNRTGTYFNNFEENTSRRASENADILKIVKSKDHVECVSLCRQTSQCSSWNWEKGTCLLHYGIPGAESYTGIWSGVVSNNYLCNTLVQQ